MQKSNYKDLLKSPVLARIVADLTSDGHLQVDRKRYVASFYSKDLNEIKKFQNRFDSLFGIKGNIRKDSRPIKGKKTIRYQVYLRSKEVCTFLKDIRTPIGDKTNNPFLIPPWIFNGNQELQQPYLRGLFDAEGRYSVEKTRDGRLHLKWLKITNC